MNNDVLETLELLKDKKFVLDRIDSTLKVFLLIDVSAGKNIDKKVEYLLCIVDKVKTEVSLLKNYYSDLKIEIAVLAISEISKWLCTPTPIEEFTLDSISCVENNADLKKAFKELKSKLSRTEFMNTNGRLFAPMYFLITESNVLWNCEEEINQLKENMYFSRGFDYLYVIDGENTNFQNLDNLKKYANLENNIIFSLEQLEETINRYYPHYFHSMVERGNITKIDELFCFWEELENEDLSKIFYMNTDEFY